MSKEAVVEKVVENVEVPAAVDHISDPIVEAVDPGIKELPDVFGKAGNTKVIFGTIAVVGAVLVGGFVIKNKFFNKKKVEAEPVAEEKGEE